MCEIGPCFYLSPRPVFAGCALLLLRFSLREDVFTFIPRLLLEHEVFCLARFLCVIFYGMLSFPLCVFLVFTAQ